MRLTTLYSKLAAAFAALLIALAVVQYWLMSYYSLTSLQERDQRLYWGLAKGLGVKIQPLLDSHAEERVVVSTLLQFIELNPSVNAFILDQSGVVRY
ncbi:MAG: hypothetical protein KDD69_18715, partial [Bdellovibrionales bacterium]|nr:hypothetical protein [Bdellovibrionales bacterium]